MGVATAVFTVLMLLCVTFAIVAAVRAARAVSRGMERASSQVRRGIDDTSIKIKAAQPGPVGQVARLRLELRASVDQAKRELAAGSAEDASLREALGLLDQLHDHARVLDRELAGLMDREPDRRRIAARLPQVRERAQEIRSSADSLRLAAQDRARRHDADGLASLREQIDIESGALRHWAPATPPGVAEAGTDGRIAGSSKQPGTSGASASGAAGASEAADGDASGDGPVAAAQGRAAVGASSDSDTGASDATARTSRWDVGGLWEARSQLPGLGRRKRSRDLG
ncbi:hypothetical protein MTQ01_07650 [Streptomyces sp. XM4193]|uniref:hypothetical protein n=1 Tax=Streptomyces sp. XM4193 TaxID=2929782 RepID=UPI001FFB3883|nr:hypothetical protein [Streptomyces sp. XM4193]MCK1795878.1 hypothetical protein [Streptomyces sp. XM4193]